MTKEDTRPHQKCIQFLQTRITLLKRSPWRRRQTYKKYNLQLHPTTKDALRFGQRVKDVQDYNDMQFFHWGLFSVLSYGPAGGIYENCPVSWGLGTNSKSSLIVVKGN